MKHGKIAIEFSDLLARVLTDSDTPWREVIGLNDANLDKLERLVAMGTKPYTEFDDADTALREDLRGTWWQVSWPEHIGRATFNSDANYSQCTDRAEALDGAVEYGA